MTRQIISPLLFSSLLMVPVLAAPQPLQDVFTPATTGGVATVERGLAKLSGHRRLLVIGAHPDDEDTSLLALVARGLGGEAAYLSLSRGEGGQNLIGPELGVGLGLVRTGELLSARRVDGARQYFTRAFDFGYTRSLDETLQRWPREVLMEDALRVVRRFRPQVVVSIFPPTARAGHGQHQAAAVVATALFEEDSPEGEPLEDLDAYPWRPQAFYRAGWFDRTSEALELDLGQIDPLDGRSILQLAMASRSQHRSQDMGTLQELGRRTNRLIPVAGAATTEGDDPFAGVDTRLVAMAAILPEGELRTEVESHLAATEVLAVRTRAGLSPSRLAAAVPPLAQILEHLEAAQRLVGHGAPSSPHRAVEELLEEKLGAARIALAAAGGVVQDVFTDRGALVPGETVRLTARLWNSSTKALQINAVEPRAADRWRSRRIVGEDSPEESFPVLLEAGETRTWEWEVEIPPEAPPGLPYFLEQPMRGDLYDWSKAKEAIRSEPFGPPPLAVELDLTVGGKDLLSRRPAVHRFRDQARGEIRRPVRVVPALEIALSPGLHVWPASRREPIPLKVDLANNASAVLEGELVLSTPEGWPPLAPHPFSIPAGGRLAVDLNLELPAASPTGDFRIRAEARVDEERFALAVPPVSYEHVKARPWPRTAESLVRIGELKLPSVERVGYIRGASDRLPEALVRIGVPLQELSTEDLTVGDLQRFPVIVVGSRAYETDPALGAANGRLLEYVRNGGRLVVQYQQYQFVRGGFAPFPLEIDRPHDRVTDEGAAVTVLAPDHPIFHVPNRIGAEDWQGWVQERGLYFPGTWDPAYTPLLSMTDPEQPEQLGGLLVARLGAGTYVYTGLAFFRQLPAGVVGGYRLFLNLLERQDREPGDRP